MKRKDGEMIQNRFNVDGYVIKGTVKALDQLGNDRMDKIPNCTHPDTDESRMMNRMMGPLSMLQGMSSHANHDKAR
jgi:hypothetical protein